MTPNVQLTGVPHLLVFKKEFIISYIHCLSYFRVYKYSFDSFSKAVSDENVYNFGKFVLKYEYKKDYEKTIFYKQIKKPSYELGISYDHSDHEFNTGQMVLLRKEAIVNNPFQKRFPNSKKKQVEIFDFEAKNLLLEDKELSDDAADNLNE